MKDTVPVITANFRPLRLVLRDTDNEWVPSLEQINNRDYDYVKLHRISWNVDVGIAPYSLIICFDGTLVLPTLPQFRNLTNALILFNKTLTQLLIGGVYCEAVAPDDMGYGSLTFSGYARILGGGYGPTTSFHRAARTKHISDIDALRLLKPETIKATELQAAFALGQSLISKLGDIPHEQVLYGTTFYVRKQWAESLVHVWTITERIVELAWRKYVVNGNRAPSKRRRTFLEDHRTWSVSAKLEVLYQKLLLPLDVHAMLDDVRKARNDFAHRGTAPTHEIATKALKSCFQLASLCASEFKDTSLFNSVILSVLNRCNLDFYPKETRVKMKEGDIWLSIPPIPGDSNFGEYPYEIDDELALLPVKKDV